MYLRVCTVGRHIPQGVQRMVYPGVYNGWYTQGCTKGGIIQGVEGGIYPGCRGGIYPGCEGRGIPRVWRERYTQGGERGVYPGWWKRGYTQGGERGVPRVWERCTQGVREAQRGASERLPGQPLNPFHCWPVMVLRLGWRYTQGGICRVYPPGIYASYPLFVGSPHPAQPVTRSTLVTSVHELLARFTLLAPWLRNSAFPQEECAPLRFRNKPPWARKPTRNGQQTRYRKDLRTRTSGISQPLQICSQTPLGVTGRLLTVKRTSQDPPGFKASLSKTSQKVRNTLHPAIQSSGKWDTSRYAKTVSFTVLSIIVG